jgi:hypothetical protein
MARATESRGTQEAITVEVDMSHDYANDDRSDSMNPNNDAYWDSLDNHADQMNPNNDEYGGGNQANEGDQNEG